MRIVHPFPQPEKARLDAVFLDPRYPEWRRKAGLTPAEHTGVDYNLANTSGDGDLGYPVVAVADGIVLHAQWHRVWGNIVLVWHAALGVSSQYAHLHQICVSEGQSVWAGEPVGSIGKGDPRNPFMAHLHFEIRKRARPADYWPGMNRAEILEAYLDPEKWLRENMSPARLFTRQKLVLWLPSGRHVADGDTIVNLESDAMAQVRVNRELNKEG
jgi:murein DD-endopeptidase MepM/ murein hydrolase activator NlpD